ncbi:putative pentatricopeptide repeat-containing protein At1g10330 [Typha latifolia]|uniref:putative pentatricopeptide repeat-containing protein At1g10330 n=1 Tax=Typha latifolia TaxID=4733 RepID=UPI003C2DCCC0
MLYHGARPNHHTFPSLFKSSSFSNGCALHAQCIHRGLVIDDFVNCSIVKVYARFGHIADAEKIFAEMPHPDVASCNAMLDALCGNSDMSSATRFFENMACRDAISWTTLISGFSRNGCFGEAIEQFKRLLHENWQREVRPNEATFVSVLSACANLEGPKGLFLGKEIHSYIIKHETQLTAFLGTALIDMYGKHGQLTCCGNVFKMVRQKEICTWNALISALAGNGKEAEALDLFVGMQAEGLSPNHITLVAALTACARAGLVKTGLRLFESMVNEYKVTPSMEHYGCIADMLSRAGHLNEAIEFIRRMPIAADASVQGALLGACKLHGKTELGAELGRQLIMLQPLHSGRYMLLRNIYAGEGRWSDAAEVREAMEKAGVKKITGLSCS